MFISWDPPFTLPGLTVQYIISVGTEQHELNSTNYTYCPLNLTNEEYQFNITTSNKVGNGSTNNITVRFQSSKKCMYNVSIVIIINFDRSSIFGCLQKKFYTSQKQQLAFTFPFTSKYIYILLLVFFYRLISFVLKCH